MKISNDKVLTKSASLLRKSGLLIVRQADQLIFQKGRSGKSAWLSRWEERWVFGTWGPPLYSLPESIDLPKLCIAFIQQDETMFVLADNICTEFGVVQLSSKEASTFYEHHFPSRKQIAAKLKKMGFLVRQKEGFRITVRNPKSNRIAELIWHEYALRWVIRTESLMDYYILRLCDVASICSNYLTNRFYEEEILPTELSKKYAIAVKTTYAKVRKSFKNLKKLHDRKKFAKERFEIGSATEEIRSRCNDRVNLFLHGLMTVSRDEMFKEKVLTHTRELVFSFKNEAWLDIRRLLIYIDAALSLVGIDDWEDSVAIPKDINKKRKRLARFFLSRNT